jgi:hypothetical protein
MKQRSKKQTPASRDTHKLPQPADKQQSQRFIAAARAAGCSEDEAVFDENLKKIVRHKPLDMIPSPKIPRTKKPAK